MVSKLLKKNGDKFYFVFRILVGLLFFLHGWMKVTAITGGQMEFMSLMGLAAVIETVGGIFIVVGFLTRPVAAIAGIQMVFAYFMAHASGGLSPLANKGEPAVLFFVAFLVLAAHGAGRWGLDNE
ncbi:MAG: DoxX family protein [Nanoarchaeota archaeon]